ncbi:hypothetical protein O7600_10500 [Micromonospora sp. WMMA1998]|uniref:hypothetical protein n=1 Tax=Micromonospora sp. WMMA1998 TaxID=3015167 RepID=UPI00248C5525|nr:hypothetical protein [Micromonospora sp. WMMA1998]WBC17225.1 hypothetical protein O7600_10500 [Micromonospora sp. WMMA1998]
MSDRMWSLAEFRFDEAIEAAEVYLDSGTGLELMARDEAIALAHERGANLVAWCPPDGEATPSCVVAKVSQPLRWEQAPLDEPALDERLWFEAPCGRDVLVGNGHTFTGRMAAWCPHEGVGYNVSRPGMGAMSDEARYFVAGFLAGNEPRYPADVDGEPDEADLSAWRAALARFRRTGSWYGRWGTCQVCGCVLLPDTADNRCHQHSAAD